MLSCTEVSSRKVQAGTWRGDEGRARETRRCLAADGLEEEPEDVAAVMVVSNVVVRVGDEDGGGKGAVKEKVAEVGRLRGSWMVVVD